ncbi:hypothetical protein [Streptomyces sp. NPDC059863]|uniref:hypothetical protein n=1 Tax=unclassified Streptomyces TaxID=2593676 RepID=UPI00365C5149
MDSSPDRRSTYSSWPGSSGSTTTSTLSRRGAREMTGGSSDDVHAQPREQAQELFQLQAETTMELGVVQRERRAAVLLADIGIDYPYTYDGALLDLGV